MTRRASLAAVALAATTALLAGCGAGNGAQMITPAGGTNNSSQPPAAELMSAINALGDGSALTTTVKLGTTAQILGPILSTLGTHLSPGQVSELSGARVSLELVATGGKTLNDLAKTDLTKSPGAVSVDFTLSANGTTYLSLRHVDQTLYLQVDVKDLLSAIGQASRYAALETKAATLPGFVQALLEDKWVALPDATLALLKSFGQPGMGTSPFSHPGLGATPNDTLPRGATSANLIGALKALLSSDVQVTRLSAGSTDRLRLTANSRVLAGDLMRDLHAVMPRAGRPMAGRPMAGRPLARRAHSRIPSQTISLSANVVHGALSELTINLGQYDKRHSVNVPLEVLFARSGPAIAAPSGAVAVDLTGLLGLASLFGGQGMGAGLGAGMGMSGLSGV